MDNELTIEWLGRVAYAQGLALQEALHAQKAAQEAFPDHVFLLEHDPVYTTGRSPEVEGVLGELPHPLVQIGRGGKITYHGPGQLVGYPVLDLRRRGRDLHRHLRLLEEVLVELSARVGVRAGTREGLTGVWVGERKLASIGVGVRRWVSLHGFAINVCGALEGFRHIVPCGLAGVEMTSLEREGATGLTVEAAAKLVAEILRERLCAPPLSPGDAHPGVRD